MVIYRDFDKSYSLKLQQNNGAITP